VARLALQIYNGLESLHLPAADEIRDARRVLEAAARAHAVGFSKTPKKYQVASYRLIRKLVPPLGLSPETLRQIALIVRFHRGSLPRPQQKAFSGIGPDERSALFLLSGILRLADAFDRRQGRRIYRLELKLCGNVLCITAPGYTETDASAERLAAARHLLEIACRLPILIRSNS
jgi:exopolyphosphatase/guanosine-5'-triphosphate,3'-diphosphate pyrophosphatase